LLHENGKRKIAESIRINAMKNVFRFAKFPGGELMTISGPTK
jgi:hypothetical protein